MAQIIASIVQALFAVSMAKREGLYGGIGAGIWKVLSALVVLAPIGIWITYIGGLSASIAVVLVAPFLGRHLLRVLRILDSCEKRDILTMIPVSFGRRAMAWFIQES